MTLCSADPRQRKVISNIKREQLSTITCITKDLFSKNVGKITPKYLKHEYTDVR